MNTQHRVRAADYAQFVADSYGEPQDTLEPGTLVVGRGCGPLELQGREGVVVRYELGSAIVQLRSGDLIHVRDEFLLIQAPCEAPEVGDGVEVTDLDPEYAGEWGVVEVVGAFGTRTKVRSADGGLLLVWPCCLRREVA